MTYTFSIIIPTFNEEKNIVNLFESIKSFNTHRLSFQVIVIDNGSTDSTVSICEKFADNMYQLPDLKISELRNFGAEKASGKYLAFFDADCAPCNDWLVIAKEIFESEIDVGVVGSFYSMDTCPTWVEKLWCESRKKDQKFVNFLPAGNCAVRRDEFIKIGGFSTALQTGEDYDLCLRYRRKGMKINNSPLLQSIHYGNAKTLREIFKREVWYGQGMLQTLLSGGISKPLVGCAMILCGVMSLLACLYGVFVNGVFNLFLLVAGTLGILTPPILYAIYSAIRSQKYSYLFLFFLIYVSYFLGRIVSIYYIASLKTKKLK